MAPGLAAARARGAAGPRLSAPALRVAVVGHVEWAEFVRVPKVPAAGEIVAASERWEGPGGGGAVAAAELARLAGEALFLTALGDDATGRRAADALAAAGVRVTAAIRAEPTRRVFVHVDAAAERTITVIGPRLAPRRTDPLPWHELARCDAVYLTAADADGVRAARAARVLVATPRALATLREAGIRLDALVGSARDPRERSAPGELAPAPVLRVETEGEQGGRWQDERGACGRWTAAPLPGPPVDAYGAGDRFAAALTWALGAGRARADALAFAAERGARALTERGPLGAPARSVGATT